MTSHSESLYAAVGLVAAGPAPLPRHDPRQPAVRPAIEASDADLKARCRAARIWDLVTALPDGLDTVVGERGYRMSGGEKQRLAIARLLLKDPADRHPRRSDIAPRLRVGGRDPAGVRRGAARPHRDRHRAPAVDDRRRRPHRRGRRRPHRRNRDATAELSARGGLYADLYRTQLGRHAGRRSVRRRGGYTRRPGHYRPPAIAQSSPRPIRRCSSRPTAVPASRRSDRLADTRRRRRVRIGTRRSSSARSVAARRSRFAVNGDADRPALAVGRAPQRQPARSRVGPVQLVGTDARSARSIARASTAPVGRRRLARGIVRSRARRRRRRDRRSRRPYVDYKVSSGLWSNDMRNWDDARDRADGDRSRSRRVHHRHERHRRSSTTSTPTATASPDWEPGYRAQGRPDDGSARRCPRSGTVIWLGAADARHREHGRRRGRRSTRSMQEEAAEARARRRLRRHIQAVLEPERRVLAPDRRRQRQGDHSPASPTACTSRPTAPSTSLAACSRCSTRAGA